MHPLPIPCFIPAMNTGTCIADIVNMGALGRKAFVSLAKQAVLHTEAAHQDPHKDKRVAEMMVSLAEEELQRTLLCMRCWTHIHNRNSEAFELAFAALMTQSAVSVGALEQCAHDNECPVSTEECTIQAKSIASDSDDIRFYRNCMTEVDGWLSTPESHKKPKERPTEKRPCKTENERASPRVKLKRQRTMVGGVQYQ